MRHTTTRRDTLRVIEAIYRYWTDKDLDQHKSHMAIYAPDFDKGLLVPTSNFRKIVAYVLPGCGLQVSKAVEERCLVNSKPSLKKLLGLDERQWAEIASKSVGKDGVVKLRKLGEARARQIMGTLEELR